jgi:hypothetical protein
MQSKKLTLQANKISPFLGHAGVGARIEVVDKFNILVLSETTRSQLILIFTLGILSIFPAWILAFDANRINGGIFGKSVLCITVFISFPFFVKYIIRFLRQRRVEFDQSKQQIQFISENMKIEHSIHFSEIQSLEIKVSDYRSDGHTIKNYTLVLSDKVCKVHELCTSDQEENILAVHKKIARFFPNINGSSLINE